MATVLKRDLAETMRWLRANGIEHGADEIIEGSLYCSGGVIDYETISLPGLGRIPRTVKQTVTYQQANDA